MKKLLNTLFVTTQGAYLAKEGECILVRIDGESKARFPVHNLGGVVCFGNVLCSPFLLGHCADNGVAVSMLTENGRFLARVVGGAPGNVLLRREQYRRADCPDGSAAIARNILLGKIGNCRTVLQRSRRDRPDATSPEMDSAINHLAGSLKRVRTATDLETIRGMEGDAARTYFAMFDELITVATPDFVFERRTRRPPRNAVNALLSFLYTILLHDIQGALESVGLDVQVGYLHRDRPGRPGLALDLMEELRPVLADRLAVSLINRGQLKPKNFDNDPGGATMMNEDGRKAVLKAYQERKHDEITHPFLRESVPIGLVPHVQALLFARLLRGDLDGYPPFLWR
mgnify:CR=1 FL=1